MNNNKKDRVLVTGACGCVGSILVKNLLRDGYKVVATDLPGSDCKRDENQNLKSVDGDLTDSEFIKKICHDVDVVVNLAAIVDIGLPFYKLSPINLDAVINLYKEAKKNNVKRFIQFSSAAVYQKYHGAISEEVKAEASNEYCRTKILADDFLLSQKAEFPKITIVRPGLIIGPRGRVLAATLATLPAIIKSFTPLLPSLKSGGTRSNWVHAEDIASAVSFLLAKDIPSGEIFNVTQDHAASISDVFNTVMGGAGVKLFKLPVPYPRTLLKLFYPLLDVGIYYKLSTGFVRGMWRYIKRKNNLKDGIMPQVDREILMYLVEDMIFDNSKIKHLGFKFKYSDFGSAWNATMDWYRKNEWIPN